MEYRSLPVVARLIAAALLLSAAAWAAAGEDGPGPEQSADWQRRLEQGKALQKQGAVAKDEAKTRFEADKKACFRKFRVNACQQEAKQQYVAAMKEARRVDNEGKALECQVKKEELADKDARRVEEAPRREAELKGREAETRAEREGAAERQAERLAGKEAKAAAGEQRREAESERIRAKREKHDRKVAERLEKAHQREADADKP